MPFKGIASDIVAAGASIAGGTVIAQLWEGQSLQAPGGSDYLPFTFSGGVVAPPSLSQYDPLGVINPNTVDFSGSGSFGTGTVPAGSSILIPQTGLYRHSMSGHGSVNGPDAIDFSAHMGTDETVADIIDGFIGWNWAQIGGTSDDHLVQFPDPLTWVGVVGHSAGAAVYWAGFNNSGSTTTNLFGFTWVIEFVAAL